MEANKNETMRITLDLINMWKGNQFALFNFSLLRTNKDFTLAVIICGVGFITQYNSK